MLFGSTTHNKVSRFATEIPSKPVETTGARVPTFDSTSNFATGKVSVGQTSTGYNPMKTPSFTKPIQKNTTTFAVGDRVLHKVFGKGMIVKAEKMGNDTMLEISFETKGTKTLMANFCKMEKL